jgi:hypothetical protein
LNTDVEPHPRCSTIQHTIRKGDYAMKYICLAYEEESALNALSRAEWDTLRVETLNYVDHLRESGRLVAAEALQSVRTATTVRVRNGKSSVTDGPFAETKEQLGGIFLIDARDLNEAIQVALQWPSARLGSIEVRPIEAELREDSRYDAIVSPD